MVIADLPGIYSLSPYTLEEVVARNFLMNERPDAVLNIWTAPTWSATSISPLSWPSWDPMVVAVNMMDTVAKTGDEIHTDRLAEKLGCPVFEISALKGRAWPRRPKRR